MRKIICFELRRCLRGRSGMAALGLAVFLAVGHFLTYCIWWLEYKQGGVIGREALEYLTQNPDTCLIYPACLYEGFIGGEGYTFWNQLYYYLIPFLAVLPFGHSLFDDERTGYLKNIYTRIKKKDFLIAKGLVTFFSGAVYAGMPYVLSFLLNGLYVPAVLPNAVALHTNVIDNMFLSDWYFAKPWCYFGVYLFFIMICGGIFAVMSLCISFVATNRLVVWMIPFLIYFSVDYLCMEFNKEYWSLCRLINPMRGEPKYYLSISVILGSIVVLMAIVNVFYLVVGCIREKIC